MTPMHDLLKWYTDIGMTVAIGDTTVDHTKVQPKVASAAPREAPRKFSQPDPLPAPAKPKAAHDTTAIAAACTTVDDLRRAIQSFEGCDLKMTAANTVFCDGNPKAKVMIIGEAPGADEDRQGLPFVGLSGQLLDKALSSIGLTRDQNIYISNIIPWRPPGNRTPTPHEIALCEPFIKRHIELVAPDILILVGGVPTKSILNTSEGITKLRGKWHDYQTDGLSKPIKAMATYHPAYLLRSPGQKAAVWKDLMMVEDELIALGLR